MKAETCIVDIRTRTGADPITIEDAVPAGDHFAVHRAPEHRPIEPWQVTHRPSGLRLPGWFWTAEHAAAYAADLAELPGDWSTTDGARAAGEAYADAIRWLVDHHQKADRAAWRTSPLPEWPAGGDTDPTADLLARLYAVAAWRTSRDVEDAIAVQCRTARDDPSYQEKTGAVTAAAQQYTSYWAIARLLRALIEHAPGQADHVAADLWLALDAGDSLDELLWEWLVVEYRINADAITAAKAPAERQETAA